ncbi:MAG: hypothetical protein EKK42_24470 [Pseudonocardiaceae bacterium]|nr:MAG: hypothetical protein EKK42_24470 [Pseudonocardiaceae bacterium]
MGSMIDVVQPLTGGWEAVVSWPADRPVQGGPSQLLVRYAGSVRHETDCDGGPGCDCPRDAGEPVGGISSSVLRAVDLRAANRDARAAQPDTNDQRDYGIRLADIAPMIAADGITDTVLVLVAVYYAVLIENGQERPVARVAEALGRKEVTIRSWLSNARKKGLFTGAPGKAGGRLTEAGLVVLRAYSRPGEDVS